MNLLFNVIERINQVIWGLPMVILILSIGIFLSLKSRFFQIRGLKTLFKEVALSSKESYSGDKKTMSGFQSILTSLAATVGVGSITGVASAISIGGPGSVFWIWISAFFGMMTAYGENYLGAKFKFKRKNGTTVGGAMSYLEKGLNAKKLATAYAFFCVIASLGMGNMAQVKAISESLNLAFNIPTFVVGIILVVILSLVLSGGISKIGKFSEILMPFISIFFTLGCVIIIFSNYKSILPSFEKIFKSAFDLRALGGGVSGVFVKKAVSVGLRRGVFSNEAGLGTTVLVHSKSENQSPSSLGYFAMFEVLIDTFFFCTLTALVILTSGVSVAYADGSAIIVKAFESGLGAFGKYFVAISLVCFAFATVIGWSCVGKTAIQYIQKKKDEKIYNFLFILFSFFGATLSMNLIFEISDLANGLMAVPNLIGIMLLSKHIVFEKPPK